MASEACPECGEPIRKLHPPRYADQAYCCSDCLLDAWERDDVRRWIEQQKTTDTEFGTNVAKD